MLFSTVQTQTRHTNICLILKVTLNQKVKKFILGMAGRFISVEPTHCSVFKHLTSKGLCLLNIGGSYESLLFHHTSFCKNKEVLWVSLFSFVVVILFCF